MLVLLHFIIVMFIGFKIIEDNKLSIFHLFGVLILGEIWILLMLYLNKK